MINRELIFPVSFLYRQGWNIGYIRDVFIIYILSLMIPEGDNDMSYIVLSKIY